VSEVVEKSRWRRPLTAMGVFVLFAGMLFWTKLRLVSDIPRSAYAVPKESAGASNERPDQSVNDETDAADEQDTPEVERRDSAGDGRD
jgi:hypothetical protein